MKTSTEVGAGGASRDPRCDEKAEGRVRLLPAAISSGVLGLLIFSVGRIENWFFQPPPCFMKSVTGIPCPGCGGTRALGALARGDVGQALALNPLVTAACGLLVGWLAVALFTAVVPWNERGAVARWLRGSKGWLGVLLAILALMHWAYLIVFLE